MPAPAIPVVSPDISVLSASVLFDISGPTPTIIVTNLSTLINPGNLKWWVVITDPDGLPIHTGSVTVPDEPMSAAWPTGGIWTMADLWTSPFIYPKITFSCSMPYNVILYVADSAANVFSVSFSQTICAPIGNSIAGYNFGQANVDLKVQCDQKNIYAKDITNYGYQGIIGTSSTNVWNWTFPADATGIPPTVPPNLNAAYVFIPIGWVGYGYALNFSTYAIYTFLNGCTIKLQYKLNVPFAVWCGIDLCKLICNMKRFYEETVTKCGEITNDSNWLKMIRITYLMTMAEAAIIQPLCKIDLGWIVKEIEKLLGYTEGCGCSESAIGINGGSSTSMPCCPPSTVTATATGSCTAPLVTLSAYTSGTHHLISGTWVGVTGVVYEVILTALTTPATGTPGIVAVGAYATQYDNTGAVLIPGNYYAFYIKAHCSATTDSGWVLGGTIAAV